MWWFSIDTQERYVSNTQPTSIFVVDHVESMIIEDMSTTWPAYSSPAAFINSRVNFVRSLVCITVGRRVQPISVGIRSLPG
jgi:hypothetical protein